jgi:DNA mismatch repair protein PMS2
MINDPLKRQFLYIVRLFNQGLDVIEVSDDGDGVPKHSRSLMAMKHATSKLSAFEELYQTAQLPNGTMQLRQLGFRGEALFSIANISQLLVVSTRTKDEQIGEKMEFRRDGYRNPSSVHDITRKVGTTVAAVKLFDALPVRRADLIKRIKQQKAKLLKLVQECKLFF